MKPFPWHRKQWAALQTGLRAGRLAHGLLLTGLPGSGTREFGLALVGALLCGQPGPDGESCGECRHCHVLAGGGHPELLSLGLEEDSRVIKVDQIRELRAFFALTRHAGRHRVCLLEPADALNESAANALLKTLEEPPSGAVILLVARSAYRLPATVRSRCQRVDLDRLDRAQAAAWLQAELDCDPTSAATLLAIARGLPLLARELGSRRELLALRGEVLRDLERLTLESELGIEVAEGWSRNDPGALLTALGSLLADLARCLAGQPVEGYSNPDLAPQLHRLAQRLDWRHVLRVLDAVSAAERLLESASTVRPRDVIEDLALRWCRPARTPNARLR